MKLSCRGKICKNKIVTDNSVVTVKKDDLCN